MCCLSAGRGTPPSGALWGAPPGGPHGVAMILIIPIAVSVHTVVSWIFAMTLRVPWNSTIFGAFFVAGAIFSGIATLIILLAADVQILWSDRRYAYLTRL